MNISIKINLLVASLAVVFALATSFMTVRLIQDYAGQQQREWARSLANAIAEGVALDTINHDAIAVREQLVTLIREEPTLEYLYIYDFNNKLFAHSFDGGFPRFLVEQHTGKMSGESQLKRFNTTDGEILEINNPLIAGMSARLHIGLNQASTQAAINQARLQVFLATLFITATGVLLGFLVARRISQPLQQLAQQVADYGAGKREDVQAIQTNTREVRALSQEFAAMARTRAAAYRELAEREQYLARTLDSIGDAVIVTDARGRVTRINPVAEILTGWRSEDARNQPIGKIFHIVNALSKELVPDPVAKVILTGKVVGLANHTVLISRSGEEYKIADSGAPILSDTGQAIGVILVFRDVSEAYRLQDEVRRHRDHLEELVEERAGELKQSNRALLNANRELEAFSYAVSHDLRAPLRAIDGFTNVLMEDYREQLDEGAQGYLARILASANRMADLIDDLLMLSSVVRTEIALKEINMSTLAEQVVTALRAEMPGHAVDIEIQTDMKVMADSKLLRILLDNLLGNAWKYSTATEKPRIVFCCRQQNGEDQYCISDNGAGFDNRYANKLFKAFSRLHGSEFEGTGIGLATAERIVHRLGGRIWGQGEEGKGATFCFTLSALPKLKLVGGAKQGSA